ncbi:MAG TPA: 3-phosphoshikimate 1-carboxyvinyltransferase [Candidatus Omnitrophota bacterium]|nr:3-phosphoshikimate 1-carboxyvinyltransferase [Candidatus Omnitrophota bacterium]
MNAIIQPTHILRGSVELPASKSYSVRAFVIAACGGRSSILSPSDCDDALAALATARGLGAKARRIPGGWLIDGNRRAALPPLINVRESGTALRLVLPLAALHGRPVRVTGEGTLCGRPNHHLIAVLKKLGVDVDGRGKKHSVPIVFKGGRLRNGVIEIDGSLSSQFVSALLIALPQLDGGSVLRVKGKRIVSSDYVTMTLQVLKRAGVSVRAVDRRTFQIPGGQPFKGLKNFRVPSDYGLAAFLMAAAALTGSNVCLKGCLSDDFIQADGRVLSILKTMGVNFKKTSRSLRVKGPFTIRGGEFSLKDCPDLLPILAVCALFADRKTTFKDIAHVRAKESDRISDLRKELLKINARVSETHNTLTITPAEDRYLRDRSLDPHHDHRLAMAFSVLGLKLGVRIKDAECISKSYPGFLSDLKILGGQVKKCR